MAMERETRQTDRILLENFLRANKGLITSTSNSLIALVCQQKLQKLFFFLKCSENQFAAIAVEIQV